MTTYKIVRMYFNNDKPTRAIHKGLTLDQAQEHCNDLETSSRTCTKSQGKTRTKRFGAWFDGYEQE